MRLAIPILMQAGLAWGACPTAGGYANTCFVSVLGSDTIGTGTITEPYRSLQKAADTAAPGDTVMIRGGRHTTAALSFISPGTSGAVQAPITFRAFQGEAAIIDGGNVAGRRFLLMLPANTHGSHYHFAGLKFENWHYYSNIATIQGAIPESNSGRREWTSTGERNRQPRCRRHGVQGPWKPLGDGQEHPMHNQRHRRR